MTYIYIYMDYKQFNKWDAHPRIQPLRFTKAANSSSSSTASVDDFNPEQTQARQVLST